MSFYQTRLLQANPQLMTMGAEMESRAGNGVLHALTGGFNALSKNTAYNENNAYRNMLMQHLNDFQHQNVGTENERINTLEQSNGTAFNSYLANASNLVHGMDAQRAQSIYSPINHERMLNAQADQNLLNSHIKQTAQQQTADMQNYINQVGDANKDGVIDIRDLNPTEQTAVQGLYGSVANKLLGTAQQNQGMLSMFNMQHKNRLNELKTQNDYALGRQKEAFAYRDKMAQMQNARVMMSSYQSLYNKSYNDYMKLSRYNPATMTQDQKLQLNNAKNNMQNYGNQIKKLQS